MGCLAILGAVFLVFGLTICGVPPIITIPLAIALVVWLIRRGQRARR